MVGITTASTGMTKAAGRPSIIVSHLENHTESGGDYDGVSFGAENPNRYIGVIGGLTRGGAPVGKIDSISIDGSNATLFKAFRFYHGGALQGAVGFGLRALPTGASGNVTLNISGDQIRHWASIFHIIAPGSEPLLEFAFALTGNASLSADELLAADLGIRARGAVIAGEQGFFSGSPTFTWTGLDNKVAEINVAGGTYITAAFENFDAAHAGREIGFESDEGGNGVAMLAVSLGVEGDVHDDFERGDENLEVSSDWTREGGTAGGAVIDDGDVAFIDDSIGGTAYLCPDVGSADHYTEVQRVASSTDRRHFECCVRVTAANNFIGVRLADATWQLYKRVGGGFTLLDSSSSPSYSVGDVMRLEAVGDQLSFYINGDLVLGPVTETDHMTVTRQGFVTHADASNPTIAFFRAGRL